MEEDNPSVPGSLDDSDSSIRTDFDTKIYVKYKTDDDSVEGKNFMFLSDHLCVAAINLNYEMLQVRSIANYPDAD